MGLSEDNFAYKKDNVSVTRMIQTWHKVNTLSIMSYKTTILLEKLWMSK